jgi:acyl-[acyl carrier protein]--UDP-N-acetylglucosamine O-acyltransferase
LKRAGLNPIQRLEIKRAFLAIYRSNHPFRIAAVEALKSEWGAEAREFFEFIVSSKRGICGRSVPRGDSVETE